VVHSRFPSRPSRALTLFVAATAAALLSAPLRAHEFTGSVVKLRAIHADGSESFGSAVVVAPDTLATACHVTREARFIEVSGEGKIWAAASQSGSLTHDLCLVSVPRLGLAAVRVRGASSLRIGERVIAAGFPGGGDLASQTGDVEALYAYDGAMVIRTSAKFTTGASGGGLFDMQGQLVGLLAFKARSGERLHFALPFDWIFSGSAVSALLGPLAASTEHSAFWERPKAAQPDFLRHSLLEAASQR
jgi:S1-C subfamily serine protease